jgi:hypothetical protein
MGRAPHSLLIVALALGLGACPSPGPGDGGAGGGTGGSGGAGGGGGGGSVTGPSCDTPEDCKVAGFDGVCRQAQCLSDVPCGDDVECGLGERCVAGLCRFTGCVGDNDCGSGRCRTETFSCAECGRSSDCPFDRPVCNVLTNKCVQCGSDLECPQPGPGHCDTGRGACTWCLEEKHCPNGLTCGLDGQCKGAQKGATCDVGAACGSGLACIQINGVSQCLETCSLYRSNDCPTGELCYKLTFTDTASLVFENGEPTGVCYTGGTFKNVGEQCSKTAAGSNCAPNLDCVPESATSSRCRRYCDPVSSLGCVAPDQCHPFIGDYWSNRYGLCYPDNGYGATCVNETTCRAALACMPIDDPASSDLLSPVCQFAIGSQPALAPCAPSALPDGGTLPDDRACRSGACVTDPFAATRDFFCFGPCKTDPDCSVGGRQGYCDTLFNFPAIGGFTGSLKGCRPTCADEAACGEYDGGYTCRVRLTTSSVPALKTTCAPPSGARRAGEACLQNADCRSGQCLLSDSRGVFRSGVCAEACNGQSDCEAAVVDGGLPDGGLTAQVSCATSTLLGFRGFDAVAGTSDDKFVSASLCLPATCASDEACGDVDAGTSMRCVPEYAPASPGVAYELRCRPPSLSGVMEAGATCAVDSDCASGVCGTLQAPSTGTGKTCFRACDASSVCAAGLTCRDATLRVDLAFGGFQALRSCVP